MPRLQSWLRKLFSKVRQGETPRKQSPRFPAITLLEDRITPATLTMWGPSRPLNPFAAVPGFSDLRAIPQNVLTQTPVLTLTDLRAVSVDQPQLVSLLESAPFSDSSTGVNNPITLTLPTPDGKSARFKVWEVSIVEPGYVTLNPDMKMYRGRGIDDPYASLAADIGNSGFHASIRSPNGSWYIDPYYYMNQTVYAVYDRSDVVNDHGTGCGCGDCLGAATGLTFETPGKSTQSTSAGVTLKSPPAIGNPSELFNNGTDIRRLRLALAATSEYTALHGGTVAKAEADMKTTLERVNQVYLSELSVEFVLVSNNINLIYNESDVTKDPYTSGNKGLMLGENQANCKAVIGIANFDIGHVFDGTNVGGQANPLGNVGKDDEKGRGVSTSSSKSPTDTFTIQLIVHEMGHQMGAPHTFNGADANLTPNWEGGTTAYEPGEGSTFMSYGNGAAADPANSIPGPIDDYFHIASLNFITDRLAEIPSVGTKITSGNIPPVANAGNDYTIPARTPFILSGSGSDLDGNPLTFTWEQYDKGLAPAVMGTDSGNGPLFRSVEPTPGGKSRWFPNLPAVLAGKTNDTGETLATSSRTLHFRLTARDHYEGTTQGAFHSDEMIVNTVDTGSGFAITNFNTAKTVYAGSKHTVTWNVAGTTGAVINTSQVVIDLSTDGGNTFSYAMFDANDGSADFTLPSNIATTKARFRVRPADGNIYYDINDADFTIKAVRMVIPVYSPFNGTNVIGSLGAAIIESNESPGTQTINFDTSVFNTPFTISFGKEMPISEAVTINGPGASLVTITGNNVNRIFNTDAAPAKEGITIRGVTLTAGQGVDGGAMYISDESVTFEDCVISNSSATEDGGAINVQFGGSLLLTRTTISGNTASDDGGGIYFNAGGSSYLIDSALVNNRAANGYGGGLYFNGATSALTTISSTIAGNSAATGGGGILLNNFSGALNVVNSTVTGNYTFDKGGGGIARYSGSGSVNLSSSIVSGNTGPSNAPDILSGGAVNANYSAIGSTTGFTLSGSKNIIGQNLKLRPLASNGGPTPTIAFEFDSPLRNIGVPGNAFFPNDQRGFPRGTEGDIGAFELQTAVVNTNNSGLGSLRDAVAESNRVVGTDTITFGSAFNTPQTINLQTGEIALTDAVTINGTGDSLTRLSGLGISRIFNTSDTPAGKIVTLRGMTLTAGSAADNGGAILVSDENVVVEDSVISSSSAKNDGGGIYVGAGGKLTLNRSTLTGNNAFYGGALRFVNGGNSEIIASSLIANNAFTGGAVYLSGQGSTLAVLNSTISGNTANSGGGGVALVNFIGALTIRNTTVTHNDSNSAGGGLLSLGGSPNINIESTVISSNNASAALDISSSTTVTVNKSAIGSADGFTLTGSDNLPFGINLKLGALDNYGGPTLTHLPAYDSPLVNAGSNPSKLGTDQRGVNRTLFGDTDIGSVETTIAPPDTTAPTIKSITSTTANGTYGVGTPIGLNVIFSESVTLTGTLNLTLDTGAVVSITGPQTGESFGASYTIGAGENSPDLNVTAIALIGGSTLLDAASNKAVLTLPVDNLATNKDIVVSTPPTDKNAPTIASITSPTNGTFQAGQPISVTLVFSENVTLNGGGSLFVFFDSGGSMVIQGPQTSSTLTGTYTVGANQNSPDLNVTAVILEVNSSLLDAAGNHAVLSLPADNLAVNKDIVVGTPVVKTYTVTNTSDSGTGSLRQAVLDANGSTGYDVITFDASFNTVKTITLATQLDIIEAVAITGKGAALTTIQGGGSNRLILTQNAPAGAVINISGLTLSGGRAGNGGGVFVGDESVTISNCILSNNSASGLGGAITVNAGKITLVASTLSGNTASFGGGVNIFNGSADIRESTLVGNTASANQGGGLYFGGTVGSGGFRLLNSTVSGNKANTYGGGIGLRNFNGKFEAISSTIVSNSVSYPAGGGGGISRVGTGTGTVFLRSAIVSGNSLASGSNDLYSDTAVDAFFSAIGTSGGFTLTNSNGFNLPYFTDLKLGPLASNGGPTQTYKPAGDSPLINAGTNYYNVATDQRGSGYPRQLENAPDIGAVEVPTVLSTVVTNANDSGAGSLRQAILNANINTGADTVTFDPVFFATPRTIALTIGQLTISDTSGATTINGPGLSLVTISGSNVSRVFLVNSGATAAISGVTISNGKSDGDAGAGLQNNGIVTVQNARFTNNKADTGGAIYNVGTLTVSNSTFDANSANTGSGFGGAIGTFSNITVSGCTFTANQSSVLGGAIVANGNATISDSTFTGNSSGAGGALRFHGTVTVTGSTLANNAASDGGGIANYGTLNVINSKLNDNYAGNGGGAIGNYNNGNLTFSGGIVTNNTATAGGGMLLTGTVTINNSQFTSNKANYGGAIKNDATTNATNSTFDQNAALTGDGQGGAIWNNAPMTMAQCTFTANHSIYGGAVFSPSGANVVNSTFTNNTANINGGAMWLLNTSIITGSTFNGNSAVNAGGAIVSHGDTTISNSTVAGNSAVTGGGIHFNQGSGTMKNVTIAYNAASAYGGGIVVDNIIVTATNAVVAGNASPDQPNVWGTLNASSSNNVLNLSAAAAGLGTLANNGGPTQTITLLPGSPAIDAGTSVGTPTLDQRGLPRVGAPDIGSVEVQPGVSGIVVNDGNAQRSRITKVIVNFALPVDAATLGAITFTRTAGNSVGTIVDVASGLVLSPASGMVSSITLTFQNINTAGVEYGSLADGRWQLAITGIGYLSTLNDPSLRRLFGDVNSDGTVDGAVDFPAFGATFNTNSNLALDFNNDGIVDGAVDFPAFGARFNVTL